MDAADFMRMRKCRAGGRVTLERMCYSRAACPGGPVALVPSVWGDTMHGGTGNTLITVIIIRKKHSIHMH